MTVPTAATVTINEGAITQGPPSGFTFVGQQVDISISPPPPADANNPITLVFTLDPSLGVDTSVAISKNGSSPIGACLAAGVANPDPCVSNRAMTALGDVQITVLTTSASSWNFAKPSGHHDAGITRLKSPKYVDLSPGIPDSTGTMTVVVGQSFSDHADDVGVYLAFNPPGGFGSNLGGCSVVVPGATPTEQANQVFNWTRIALGVPLVNLLPGQSIRLSANPQFICTNPAAVNGQNWQLKAIADVHADDAASCDTLGKTFNGECAAAVNGDDDNDDNNTMVRGFPIVRAH